MIDDIIGINFAPNNDSHIEKISVANVTTQDNGNNSTVPGTVANLSMGSTTDFIHCLSCHNTKSNCGGHPGHIKMGTHMVNILCFDATLSMLKIICKECSGIVVTPKTDSTIRSLTQTVSSRKKRGIKCENILRYTEEGTPVYCGAQHSFVSENRRNGRGTIIQELSVYDEVSKTTKKVSVSDLLPSKIAEIFSRITPETLKKLGITNPELAPVNYVNRNMFITPNSARPNMYSSNQNKLPKNDINVLYNSVLKELRQLGDMNMGEYSAKNIEIIKNIQKIWYNFNRPSAVISDKTYASYFSLLGSKKGHIRNIVLGQRVLNVMRHFITGDPMIRPGEVSIPQHMAMKIAVEEIVTVYNQTRLMQYVANGTKVYPRCVGVYKKSTNSHYTVIEGRQIILEPGDKVYRDMIDGDKAAFCRQPTLMKSNITSNIVRVDPEGKSIRFNPNDAVLYGADYDGDEMNLYLSVEQNGANEMHGLSSMSEHIISNGYGKPIIGQIQDGLLGLALLTRDRIVMNLNTASKMFDDTGLFPSFRFLDKKNGLYSGRDVLTVLFKHLEININYRTTANYYSSDLNPFRTYSRTETEVIIEGGVFMSGIIDAKTVGGKKHNSLYHLIYHKYGAKITKDVIWYMQRIAINYLNLSNATISLSDFMVSVEQQAKIREHVFGNMAESQLYAKNLRDGNIVAPSNKTMNEFYETEQLKILSSNKTFNKFLHDGIDYDNNYLYFCVYSGSKGSSNNIAKSVVSTGQITINGNRLEPSLDGRSNHFYPRDSDDPRARGFIVNSQSTGYTPCDLLSSSHNDRDGVVKKALATAKSGAANRDGMCSLDGSIIDWFHGVTMGVNWRQPLYGGDGMDPRATYKIVSNIIYQSRSDLAKIASGRELEQLLEDRDFCRSLFIKHQLRSGERVGTFGYIPINMPLIMSDIYGLAKHISKPGTNTKMNWETIMKFIETIPRLYFNKNYTGHVPEYYVHATRLFQAYLRYELRSEIVNKMSIEQIDLLMHLIEINFINNFEDPGRCVGMLATMAVSEPNTQQMLNSIHGKSGVKIETFQDYKDAVITSKMKNPMMEIYFKPEIDIEGVQDFAKNIEMLYFRHFVSVYQIFYEQYDHIVHPKYVKEQKLVNDKAKIFPFPNDLTNWCIRFEFNISHIIAKNIKIETIYTEILKQYSTMVHIIFSTLNVENPIMRVYLRQDAMYKYALKTSIDVRVFVKDLLGLIVRGVNGIKSTYIMNKEISVVEDDKIVNKKINYITTDGTNLGEILLYPQIDTYLTRSNSVHEMMMFFGVGNAYNVVVDGLRASVEDAYYSHYTVFATEMTSIGFTAINRHGSEQRKTSVCQLIADGSFYTYLKSAVVFGKTDYVVGINSALIMGTTPKVGTNYVQVCINEKFVENNSKQEEKALEDL